MSLLSPEAVIPRTTNLYLPASRFAPGTCSGFIATGSYTADGKIAIGHNNWTDYMGGERWNVIADIVPQKGNHFIMDCMPGLIHSGDDFVVSAAGILITETTITQFKGFDPKGIPEFVRAPAIAPFRCFPVCEDLCMLRMSRLKAGSAGKRFGVALRGGFEVALGHLRFFAEGAAPAGTRFIFLANCHQCVAQVE